MRILNKNKAKYFTEISRNQSCQFCHQGIVKKQECKTLAGLYWRVMVCLYPYSDGNLMIIPKRHITKINQINKTEWSELREVMINAQKALAGLFKTNDFNIALNIGKKAGNSMRHLHWQIIPRTKAVPNAEKIFASLEIITVDPFELKNMINQKIVY